MMNMTGTQTPFGTKGASPPGVLCLTHTHHFNEGTFGPALNTHA